MCFVWALLLGFLQLPKKSFKSKNNIIIRMNNFFMFFLQTAHMSWYISIKSSINELWSQLPGEPLVDWLNSSVQTSGLNSWTVHCRISDLLVVMRTKGNTTEAVILSAPPLLMSCHTLLGLRLCFPIMPSLPAGWFKQAVFLFSLSIIPCPVAAPCTLHIHQDRN